MNLYCWHSQPKTWCSHVKAKILISLIWFQVKGGLLKIPSPAFFGPRGVGLFKKLAYELAYASFMYLVSSFSIFIVQFAQSIWCTKTFMGLQFFHPWLLKTLKYYNSSPLQPGVMFMIIIIRLLGRVTMMIERVGCQVQTTYRIESLHLCVLRHVKRQNYESFMHDLSSVIYVRECWRCQLEISDCH